MPGPGIFAPGLESVDLGFQSISAESAARIKKLLERAAADYYAQLQPRLRELGAQGAQPFAAFTEDDWTEHGKNHVRQLAPIIRNFVLDME